MPTEMPDTKTTLLQLLNAIGIQRVVYVDDVFTATAQRVLDACNDLTLGQIRETKLFPDSFFEPEEEEVSRDRIRTQIDQMARAEIVRAFATIAGLQGDDGIDLTDPIATQMFVSFFESGVQIVTLNLPEFLQNFERLLTEVPPSKTLFVFDEDFRHDGGSEQEGRRLAADLVQHIGAESTFLALLTHTVSSDDNAEELRQIEIGGEHDNLKDRIVVIAKRRLSEQQEGFAWRFKLALLTRRFDELKKLLRNSIGLAHTAAEDQINELGVQDFERIIFHSSHNEGAWAPETLTRVFSIHYGKQLIQSFRGTMAVHDLSENASLLCQVPTDAVSAVTQQRAVALHRIERYDEHQVVNALHLPLELGDVFKTTTGDERLFVLLGQPCDLAVRSHGLRSEEPALDQGFLAVMVEIEFSSKKPDKKPLKTWEHFLPWFDSGDARYSYANLTKVFAFPAWLLDLTVFNADGTCRLTHTQASLPLLIPAWRGRLRTLIERAGQRLAKCRSAGNSDAELLQMVLALPPGGPFRAEQSGGANDWCLSLNLQRIRRIREPFATDLYSDYGHWITRTGFPHELTRLEAK